MIFQLKLSVNEFITDYADSVGVRRNYYPPRNLRLIMFAKRILICSQINEVDLLLIINIL